MRRLLLLVRHAPTAATRRHAFPGDEPLDAAGRAAAAGFNPGGGPHDVVCSPAARCVQTARAAGLADVTVDGELAECDFGRWAGRTLAEVHAADPAAAGAWMSDPASAPHGGESLGAFAARVAGWLDRQAELDGRAIVITHAGVVRAAVVHALGAPLDAFWRLDASPLSVTELRADDGRWTVARVNCPGPPDGD